jgi:hypothetical protein
MHSARRAITMRSPADRESPGRHRCAGRSPETSALALQVVQAAGDLGRSLGGPADQVQILRALSALRSDAIGADGNLEVTLANSAQGLTIAETTARSASATPPGATATTGSRNISAPTTSWPRKTAVRATSRSAPVSKPIRRSSARPGSTSPSRRFRRRWAGGGDNRGVQALARPRSGICRRSSYDAPAASRALENGAVRSAPEWSGIWSH